MCFNTQPPEGGWPNFGHGISDYLCFNTQPPEGGWSLGLAVRQARRVSTHSRPKAAAPALYEYTVSNRCFNTQPPEGGCYYFGGYKCDKGVSTHSRPKAAGGEKGEDGAAGAFQHTAARRRLVIDGRSHIKLSKVSTHSRPKAAALLE